MENKERISINIWDDFYEDGFVPPGEIQSTYIYVEEEEDYISKELQKTILSRLLDYIKLNLELGGAELAIEHYDSKNIYPESYKIKPELFHINRWQINISHLSHKILNQWMEHFESKSLFINDVQLDIYSES